MQTAPEGSTASVVQLDGELDVARASEVAGTLESAAAGTDAPLVLDLGSVTFLDCAALRPLLDARNRLGDRLWLRQPARPVTRLLELAQLTATFQIDKETPTERPAA